MEKPFDRLLREQCEALANLDSTLADLRRGGKGFSPVPPTLNTVTEKVCADICASISSNRAA